MINKEMSSCSAEDGGAMVSMPQPAVATLHGPVTKFFIDIHYSWAWGNREDDHTVLKIS